MWDGGGVVRLFRKTIACAECGCLVDGDLWPAHEKWHANIAEAVRLLAERTRASTVEEVGS